jgi:hypothetical protein
MLSCGGGPFTVTAPLDDAEPEDAETVVLTLLDSAEYDPAPPSQAVATILDDDTAPPQAGTVVFQQNQ